MTDEQNALNEKSFEQALRLPLPQVYANGFVNGYGPSDITTVFQYNGSPNLLLTLSFTTAKTLANELRKVVEEIEKRTSTTIMTIMEYNDVIECKNRVEAKK